jgi:hypothetical protein
VDDDGVPHTPGQIGGVSLDDQIEIRRMTSQEQITNSSPNQVKPRLVADAL